MHAAGHAARDAKRWSILQRLKLLNADPDAAFDRLTRVAARATGAHAALITFIGPDKQWIPSRVGWERETTTLLEAFCVCALDRVDLLEVGDATLDARFRDNPLVTGPEGIRFYAGQPLIFDGVVLGTLCVLARDARVLNASEKETLVDLAAMACDLIAQRNEHFMRVEHEENAAALGAALRGSEARLEEAQRVAKIGSWELRPDADEALFSTGVSGLVPGYSPRMTFREFQSAFRPAEWWLDVDLIAPVDLELDLVGSNGTRSWFRWISHPVFAADGRMTRIVGTLQDISAAILAHQQLRLVEQRFRLLWDTTPDVVVMLDESNTIQFVNPALHKVFGHDPASLVGQDLAVLQPERLREAHRQGFRRYLASGLRRLDWNAVETTGLHAAGHEIPVEISFSDMEVDGRRLFAACIRDISARKAGELRQSELASQLRNAQKMEAIGGLAGGIAHDFNNVLAGMLGNSALALDALDVEHEARPYLDQIQKGGKRGRNLVRQILSFARRQPQALELCDMNRLIEDNLSLLRTTVPEGVELKVVLAHTNCCIEADPTQIGQVLSNLVTNAWQALRDSPKVVEIGVEALAMGRHAAPQLKLSTSSYVHLWVRDFGHGMDRTTAARVFEPFFTTKPQSEGTGLGLAVVHGIVGAHGGEITVESELGRGSVFHVYLPIAASAKGSAAPSPPTELAPRGAGQHVLYVDDDEVMTVLVERLLQRLGYRATVLQSSHAALALVANDPLAFDLVLTDFDMPGLTGLQLAERLSFLRPSLPVVVSTGHLTDEIRDRAAVLGIKALLQKEHTVEELGDVLRSALAVDSR